MIFIKKIGNKGSAICNTGHSRQPCNAIGKTAVILLFIGMVSCSCSNFYGNVDLGNRYILWIGSGSYRDIMYCAALTYPGNIETGIGVIEKNVIKYSYNEIFIIAQTFEKNGESGIIEYWLIDKTIPIDINDCKNVKILCSDLVKSGLIGPMDSVTFVDILKQKDIDLKLENARHYPPC